MSYKNVVINSFGYHIPEVFISSDEIEQKLNKVYQRLKLPEGRLELQTGIKTRGVWPNGTRPSDLSTKAAIDCLRSASINNSQVDLLIHASVCRDFLEPATASVIHQKLNLRSDCLFFDLSNACLGVISAMKVASDMIESGAIKSALIVSGENSGPLLDETIEFLNNDEQLTRKTIKNYIANLTIGSAATAILLTSKSLAPDAPQIIDYISNSDTEANTLCQGDGNTHGLMMQTDSEELLKAGVGLVQKTWPDFLNRMSWTNESIDLLIGHQVGVAHRLAILSSIEFDQTKDYSCFEKFGNTGSSALPLTMMLAAQAQKLKKGDQLALLGIGSGLNTMMVGIKW